ncbi:MAG: hypothetical protein A3F54_01020 [Candidatus Kerfeldbacteria bacterium RIFCSPHIGHO2_12_FULL_48_17]|uniref:Metal-dependent carboxypeptidase n=1 Tax=Candidatus Kerfeldbacteria bacterium RIFCSPHIGHO2_12_FULL_48_17 TaxID=1798542 RepID=A0A1G2B094_9BACT|nr:MAG: hypothetical protein A3F54_01020 [Candidatus Kerfeldbacteria bacterium RIFCSPHIGHO2_12_FULL_48_17]
MKNNFSALRTKLKEIAHLNTAMTALMWDQEVKMPLGGAARRAETMATLSGVTHDKFLSTDFVTLLTELKKNSGAKKFDQGQAATIKDIWKTYEREKRIPKKFIEDEARAISAGQTAWQHARKQSKFSLFAGELTKLVELARRKADYIGFRHSPYDALLDLFEPEVRTQEVSIMLDELKKFLIPFLGKVFAAAKKENFSHDIFSGNFPLETQKKFNREIATKMGFDWHRGRFDESTHPFTVAFHPEDVRITTRYSQADVFYSIISTVHETGHALYEQGIEPRHFGTALAQPASYGIHESQSKLWENMVGRSTGFWKYFYPRLQELFPEPFGGISLQDFYNNLNAVIPGPIRTEADELTFNLHIILRFEIERDLIEGTIAVRDLPEIWNAKTKEYLGLTPKNDAEGVLQDIHWSQGGFGYFPSYILGNLYAAQLYARASQEMQNLETEIALGHFEHLLNWLRKKVHRHGKKYDPQELMMQATGEGLRSSYFIRYIEKKYADIYQLKP